MYIRQLARFLACCIVASCEHCWQGLFFVSHISEYTVPQDGETGFGGEPAEYQEGILVQTAISSAEGEAETLAEDFSSGDAQHRHEAAAEAEQANGAAGVGEENAKEKLRQMLEAQKAQDPNFAKLTGMIQTALVRLYSRWLCYVPQDTSRKSKVISRDFSGETLFAHVSCFFGGNMCEGILAKYYDGFI